MKTTLPTVVALGVILACACPGQQPVGTAFTYQGTLTQTGTPVNGFANFTFDLFTAETGGSPIATMSPVALPVTNGFFTSTLDFGAAPFATGDARWIQVTVNLAALIPRQRLTATPFSLATRGIKVDSTNRVGIGAISGLNSIPQLMVESDDLVDAIRGRTNGDIFKFGHRDTNFTSSLGSFNTNAWPFLMFHGEHSDTAANMIQCDGTTAAPMGFVHDDNLKVVAGTGNSPGQTVPLSTIMTWHTDGRVGIGTQTTQIRQLEVRGGAAAGIATDGDLHLDSNGPRIYHTGVGPLRILANGGNSDVVINESGGTGKVGIGTSQPSSALEVMAGGSHQFGIRRFSQPDVLLYMGFENSNYARIGAQTATTSIPIAIQQFGGNVGIGTTSPTATLDVNGSLEANAFRLTVGNSPGRVLTVDGSGNGTWQDPLIPATGAGLAVQGNAIVVPSGGIVNSMLAGGAVTDAKVSDVAWSKLTSVPSWIDNLGIALPYSDTVALTGTAFTIQNGPNGDGIRGEGQRGVYGSGNTGVYGFGLAYGVQGHSSGFGVYGNGSDRGVSGYGNYGVHGHGTTYGVYSVGATGATGTKAFTIDHPLDPENKVLLHYSTEGPEPQNAYNGVARMDDSGSAWVDLPEYFEKINKDFRYQLTCVGGFAPVYIAREIESNRFQIAGGRPGLKVSWEVKAVRNDRFVQVKGAPEVQEKAPEHRGKYLQPELYGQPPEKGQFYRPDTGQPAPPTPPRGR